MIGAEYHLKHLQARMCHALAKAAQMMCIHDMDPVDNFTCMAGDSTVYNCGAKSQSADSIPHTFWSFRQCVLEGQYHVLTLPGRQAESLPEWHRFCS